MKTTHVDLPTDAAALPRGKNPLQHVTLVQWIKRSHDARGFASAHVSANAWLAVPSRVAADLDRLGSASKYAGIYSKLPDGATLAIGHGVAVRFPSGKWCTFRGT